MARRLRSSSWLRSGPRANSDRRPPLRSEHRQGDRKGHHRQRPGLQSPERRADHPHQRPTLVGRGPAQNGGPHQGTGRRGEDLDPQHPAQCQQGGRSGRERQVDQRGRTRPDEERDPGTDQEVRGQSQRHGQNRARPRSWRSDGPRRDACPSGPRRSPPTCDSTHRRLSAGRRALRAGRLVLRRLSRECDLATTGSSGGTVNADCSTARRTASAGHRPPRRQRAGTRKHAAGIPGCPGLPGGSRGTRLLSLRRRRAGRFS